MRVVLWFLVFFIDSLTPAQAQTKEPSEYNPALVLKVLAELRKGHGDANPPRLNACLRNSADNRWSDLQAHFYCWMKADQRACFTGAVDGELKDHSELKGDYDKAFVHCQEARGRAYGINFDRPLSRLTPEQGEVFKNLLYRQKIFSKLEQKKILEAFYGGPVPERKPAIAAAVLPPPPAVTAKPMIVASTLMNPDMEQLDGNASGDSKTAAVKESPTGFPKSCQINTVNVRTRQKPDSKSSVVAILRETAIQVLGPPLNSVGQDMMQWYPVEFRYKGKLTNAFLAVSLVDCGKEKAKKEEGRSLPPDN